MGKVARRLPSLLTVSTAWVVISFVLAVGVSLALAWTSAELHRTSEVVERDTQCMVLGDQITMALLLLDRALERGEGEPARAGVRDSLERRIRAMLTRERGLARSAEERELAARTSDRYEEYLRVRSALVARGASPAEVLAGTAAPLEATIATLADLRDASGRGVARAEAEADDLDDVVGVVATAATIALAIAVLVLAIAMRRLVAVPLRRLRDAIGRFRAGDRGVRVRAEGPPEVAEIGGALDEMMVEIGRRRDEQLAFIAGVAHDLRGPLGPLKMAIGLLASEPSVAASSSASRRAEIADRQTERLARVIDDLLDAARVESGRLEVRRERFDLAELARTVVATLAPTAPERTIEVRAPAHGVPVEGDPERIEQVVTNLVSNACKYSRPESPIEVTLELEQGEAVLAVIDRGIGIPAEAQRELFVPFRRHAAARAVAPGSGLGLSVARRIVEAHGGRIDVESAPGVGSTFRVRLPRSDGPPG